ncbi:type II toxin-antitoxin system PemK/MazF family toxin [Marinobacter nauticus]|uniref:type II toxin-antitoxin system PemK/MazF family toxin n=1 Tax=Marinobacter nauticus TaxID=2743 RepID=UPI00355A2142
MAVSYAPAPDGEPDPGEIVWTWVPYEEDHSRGKDRPVLIVGHDGPYLLVLMLTSKDRNNASSSDADYLDMPLCWRWFFSGKTSACFIWWVDC